MESLIAEIDGLITSGMKAAAVPGAAVAIVKNDEAVFLRGYGHRNADSSLPVTTDTLFPQCSITKAFTALSASLLADDGILDLDRPVARYLPWFSLTDKWAADHVTPRDFLAHRSGFGGHDDIWFLKSDLKRRNLVQGMRHLPMTSEPRATWEYSNHGYALIGILVEELSGQPWEQVVINRILRPTGMTRSGFMDMPEFQTESELAEPFYDGQPRPPQLRYVQTAMNPAGGLMSSAREMTRWIRVNLNRGLIDGMRVASEESIKRIHCPQTVLPWAGEDNGELWLNGCYCMGWFREVYKGRIHLFHEGSYPGFRTMLSLFPKENLGIAAMCNRSVDFPITAARTIADKFLC